jgi:hypothetical protein
MRVRATFSNVLPGSYTVQASKGGYVSGSAQGVVASGAKTELSSTLQAQPSGGIPGFPIASVVIGVLLCTAWLWFYSHKPRPHGCVSCGTQDKAME